MGTHQRTTILSNSKQDYQRTTSPTSHLHKHNNLPKHSSCLPTITPPPSSPTSTAPPEPCRMLLAPSSAATAIRHRAPLSKTRLRPSTMLLTLPPSSPASLPHRPVQCPRT